MAPSDRLPKGGPSTRPGLDAGTTDWEKELERWPWTFARTMAHIPHWYVVRDKSVPAADYDEFAKHIREQGFEAVWTSPGGKPYENIYFLLGKWKYWQLGEIINRDLQTSSHVEPA